MCIVIGLSFCFCFRLQQSGFHWIINDGVISRVRRKWKCSDSFDSHSVMLMTLLTTLIFDFHKVISVLTALHLQPRLWLGHYWKPTVKQCWKEYSYTLKFKHPHKSNNLQLNFSVACMTISSNLFGHVTFYNFSKAKMMVCSSNGVKLPG